MSRAVGNTPSPRAVPFYCPYCGDEDLRPDAADGVALPHGTWRCGACQLMFALKRLATSPVRTEDEVTE
ncbi:hypothetical protein [Rhodococcus sp. X156]|uniref:hypothetical protein n=1 Tax=Rhodococcus sp. X156 TaxID=2499145 RepID=UPI000FD90064|nr:hypothetical protein [Rhodococcus sp. X156]